MSKCQYLIDISPYDPLCDHPLNIHDGGPTEANCEECPVAVEDLRAENAELRELAGRAWKAAESLCQAFEGPCRGDGTSIYAPCPLGVRDEKCVYGQIQRDLRELGVEVGE